MLKIGHTFENDNTGQIEVKQTEPYIIFTVDNEEFGIEAQKVLEMVGYMAPIKMPNNFGNVQGMASYRGKIIPIVDLRMVFGMEPIAYDDNTVSVVVKSGSDTFGITAERVLDLEFVPVNSIKKVSALTFGEKTKYLKSVANFGERLVLLLDLDKMIETKPDQLTFAEPVQPESFITIEAGKVLEEIAADSPSIPENIPEDPARNLIDPRELEDLLNGVPAGPGQEEPEPLVEELEINEPEILGDSSDAADLLGIITKIPGLKIEMGQLVAGFEPPEKADDKFDDQQPPEFAETEELEPFAEPSFTTDNQGLMDSAELESILAALERGRVDTKELAGGEGSNPAALPEPAELNNTEPILKTESPAGEIFKPEQIREILSGLESKSIVELPEDLFQMKNTAEIQLDVNQTEEHLPDEAIADILTKLGAESRVNSKEQLSDRSLSDLQVDRIKNPEER